MSKSQHSIEDTNFILGNSLVPQMSNLSLLEGSYAAPATSEPWMQPSSSAKGKASLIDPENSYYNLEAGTLLQPDQDTTFRDQYSNVADSARWPEAYRQECSGSSQPTQDLLGEQLPQELDSHSLQTSQYPLQPGFPISGLETSGQEDGKIPSRTSQELDQGPPPTPPRPQVTTSRESLGRAPTSDAETPQSTAIRQQRSETYQIKQITWFDASSPTNPRKSPIMVQNANGPCPLLALVNALTLSTPSNITTALVDTLRVREQVSLGLLLDAVFDELMSGRRGDAAHELPDVSDLYSFLVTLHTGMNVNPRFVPPERIPNIMDASMLDLPATVHESRRPGGFEETNEMRLYSTFSVPLIHGWLPPRTHPTFAAVERAAKTYEDAQNLMFRDEELEDKLQHQGLNQDEQLLLEDIASVKYFLTSSATQLTRYGLDTITEALQPGSVAILFRNDHFSTLYKHPESGQLLALVTDMGYAGHDEVVWESLVDVSGEGSEFFAGDFRPVGNTINEAQQKGSNKATQDDQGWTTVPESSSNKKARKSSSNNAGPSQDVLTSTNPQSLPTPPLEETYNLPTSPTTEQEDHDLALAMQLQEEEEDRSRQEVAAREREDALSRAYLESQTNSANPGRRRNGGRRQQQEVRPMVPPRGGAPVRRDPEAGEDMPPPSYEQAAKGPAYHPPSGAPDYPNGGVAAGPGNSGDRPPLNRSRQQSAYSQQAGNFGGPPAAGRRSQARQSFSNRAGGSDGAPGVMRRRSNGMGGFDGEDDGKKDCIVM